MHKCVHDEVYVTAASSREDKFAQIIIRFLVVPAGEVLVRAALIGRLRHVSLHRKETGSGQVSVALGARRSLRQMIISPRDT